jgi:hypothetical protein
MATRIILQQEHETFATGRKDPKDRRSWERGVRYFWNVIEIDTKDEDYFKQIARFDGATEGRAWAEVFLKSAGMAFVTLSYISPEAAFEQEYVRNANNLGLEVTVAQVHKARKEKFDEKNMDVFKEYSFRYNHKEYNEAFSRD